MGARAGELLLRTTWDAVCVLRGLRNRDNTAERIDAAHRSLRNARTRQSLRVSSVQRKKASRAATS